MKSVITAIAIALCSGAASAEWSIQLHTISHHFKERPGSQPWNERNAGVGIRHASSAEWSAQAGVFRNSEYRTSVYALADYTPLQLGPVSLGVFGGVSTGYERGVTPVAGAVARWQAKGFNVTLRAAPQAKAGGSAVATVELGFSF